MEYEFSADEKKVNRYMHAIFSPDELSAILSACLLILSKVEKRKDLDKYFLKSITSAVGKLYFALDPSKRDVVLKRCGDELGMQLRVEKININKDKLN